MMTWVDSKVIASDQEETASIHAVTSFASGFDVDGYSLSTESILPSAATGPQAELSCSLALLAQRT